jgi:hypothetical protein
MPIEGQSAITNNDAPHNIELTGDSAVDDFLKRLTPTDAEEPSGQEKKTEGKPPAEDNEDATEKSKEDEGSAEKPEATDEDEGSEKAKEADADDDEHKYAEDETYVKIKVGEEEHEVSVKDLRRLYGQEASLTKKSMEVSEQRTRVDAEMAKNVAATAALLDRAKARFEPYSKVDFLLAAKELSAEDYTNLRTAATAAYEDVQFLENNLNGFVQAAQQRQNTALVERAKEAIKILSGPVDKGGIENFDQKKFDDIRVFGMEQGLDKTVLDNIVDPVAIRLLNDAMLYQRGKSKVITKVVNKTPKKVIKTTHAKEANSPGDKTKVNAALKKLRMSGSTDDAANAFMASWETSE